MPMIRSVPALKAVCWQPQVSLRDLIDRWRPHSGPSKGQGVPTLAYGAIHMDSGATSSICARFAHDSAFGRCLTSLRVNQYGMVFNVSSEASPEVRGTSSCSPGYGPYREENNTAQWIFPGVRQGQAPHAVEVEALPPKIHMHTDVVLNNCTLVFTVSPPWAVGFGGGGLAASCIAHNLSAWSVCFSFCLPGGFLCARTVCRVSPPRLSDSRA
jgi:hypothetical protein